MYSISPLKTSYASNDLRSDIKIFFSISLLVFLFVLFFQPFNLDHLNANNKLLFISGLAAIIFIFSYVFHIWIPSVYPKFFKTGTWEAGPAYITSVLVIIFTSVSYTFYLYYVGSVSLSMYLVFKVVIICIVPEAVLRYVYKERLLKHQIRILKNENGDLLTLLEKHNIGKEPESVELYSENRTEKVELQVNDLLLIKSADNYIELYYKEQEQTKKKLIRSTLKNVEEQLSKYNDFVRCHRTSMVNIRYVVKLIRNYGVHKIKMIGFEEEIPVSRQYLLRVKDAIDVG